MKPEKTAMPVQDPKIRITNFDEVALGYTEAMARDEAERCLHCRHQPCVQGCPVNVNIPDFIEKVKAGDYEGAYEIISLTTAVSKLT